MWAPEVFKLYCILKKELMRDLKLAHKLVDESNERISKEISSRGVVEIRPTQTILEGGYQKIASIASVLQKNVRRKGNLRSVK